MTRQAQELLALLGDQPVPDQDLLNFTRYVNPLVELLTNRQTETPLTIGLFGRWGSGKTTLMQMIEKHTDRDEMGAMRGFHVWFNPWQYQKEDNLVIPLLHTIQDRLMEYKLERLGNSISRIATVVAQVSASVLLKTATVGNLSLEDIEKRVNTYNEKHAKGISAIRTLRQDLQGVVNEITMEGEAGRLVIYIDDLDRCLATQIVELLEAVKLFLDLKHLVVFIAIDKDIVQQGIQAHYKDFNLLEGGLERLTADYIDKMVQLPLYLYPLGADKVQEYFSQLPSADCVREQSVLFRDCLLPNPRKIKRVLNIYALQVNIARNGGQNLDWGLLAKLVLLQQQWPDFYRRILSEPSLAGIMEKVYKGTKRIDASLDWSEYPVQMQKHFEFCQNLFYTSPLQLRALFTQGTSFLTDAKASVDLKPYLFMLG